MKLTVDLLKNAAKELNEVLDPDPPIKITTKSTISGLTKEIKATIDLLEKGDIISQKTMDILVELEIDVVAGVKIKDKVEKKNEKGKTAKKEKDSKDCDIYGYKIGSKNNLFIETVKKNPMTMGEIRKQEWNNGTTFYSLLNILIKKKIAKVDKDKKIFILK